MNIQGGNKYMTKVSIKDKEEYRYERTTIQKTKL